MSVVSVGGRRYAANLYWLERGGRGTTARMARRLGRTWFVHRDERTGFAGDAEGSPEALPALALALMEAVGGEFWMALVEGVADGGGVRYALVKTRGGAVLADGDEVFGDRAAAVEAFERARPQGWLLYATPGLETALGGPVSEISILDPEALGEAAERAGAAIVLGRAVPARRASRRLASAAACLTLVAAAGLVWIERDALLVWFAPQAEAPEPSAPSPEVAVSVDGAALTAACRQALIRRPPFMPAWRIERIACEARFADPELAGLRPELAGRPVLLVRWRLASGHSETLQRRLAEAHLSRWHAAAVAEGRAWAAVPLAPVLRVGDVQAPPFVALRRAVDRAFGAVGARLAYVRDPRGGWTVAIEGAGPLSRLGALAGGIAGLEVTSLSRGAAGGWRLEGRPAAPETMTVDRLRALGIEVGDIEQAQIRPDAAAGEAPEAAGDPQPGTEAGDGTQ